MGCRDSVLSSPIGAVQSLINLTERVKRKRIEYPPL